MGLIIGAAIIADDFIQPSSRNVAMPVRAQHPTPALYESDHQAWSMKQGAMKSQRPRQPLADRQTALKLKWTRRQYDNRASG
jgi:hypothetical protein